MSDKKIRKIEGIQDDIRNMLITETRKTGGDPSFLFEILEGIILNESWKDLMDDDGNPVGSLQRLIESPPPVGCGMPINRLRQLLKLEHRHEGKSMEWKDRMTVLRKRLDAEIPELNPTPGGNNQHTELSDMSESNISKTGGNSRAYLIALLKRDAPNIAERVINDEISAAKGMREYRKSVGEPEYLQRSVNMTDANSAYETLKKFMPEYVLRELTEILCRDE